MPSARTIGAVIRPGWLVALSATVVMVSAWLPWLTTQAGGGGRVSAAGGAVGSLAAPDGFGAGQLILLLCSVLLVAAAMAARDLMPLTAAIATLVLSLGLCVLIWWYHHSSVGGAVGAGYGWYLGATGAGAAAALSVWTLVGALRSR
ncbi:hypothetical protein MFAL_36230 [Mycolicibacterium fallax]|nr:hypothetical protein MFAL_36230 [Mycolicibacterium fallax]